MDVASVRAELERVVAEYGEQPYQFFWILTKSDNPNLDLQSQNAGWGFVKEETWHSLDLAEYVLWSVSDNGDLLWWNGEQTIAMNPRDSQYVSEPVGPLQFLRLVGLGKVGRIFPAEIECHDS
ncbi:hypothetical protein [Billgrantia desiderata]|uniref:hypothetical protein n=1 Tax=Billgrantia desiderata TaxID=52021 RepID=UPI003F2EFB3A